jgi:hypothetical protein
MLVYLNREIDFYRLIQEYVTFHLRINCIRFYFQTNSSLKDKYFFPYHMIISLTSNLTICTNFTRYVDSSN